MFQTQEVARNTTPEIEVRCAECGNKYSIVQSLQELPLKTDYGSVVEGVLICPHCQNKKHVYYMTEHLRNEQRLLQRRVLNWHSSQTSDNFKKLVAKKKSYQQEYDRVQDKFKKEFGNGSTKE